VYCMRGCHLQIGGKHFKVLHTNWTFFKAFI
jgi:hypothetical protein